MKHNYKKIRLYPCLAILLLLGTGCLPSQRAVPPEELPLKPLSDDDTGQPASLEHEGQQAASLQLTQEGREYLRSGRLEEAMSKFQKAISLSISNPYAYYYLGEARYRRQEYHQSLPLLDKAELLFLRDSVWLSRVHALRGKNYEALSRFEEARGQYRQALAEDPNNPEAQEGIERLQNPEGFQ
jgi:tetratricopeptide (TPR) repeat protein